MYSYKYREKLYYLQKYVKAKGGSDITFFFYWNFFTLLSQPLGCGVSNYLI